jgi:hypothetical protein
MAEVAVTLSEADERELRRRAAQYTRPHREVIRTKVVLLAAEGCSDCEIARRLDCTGKTAGKWRTRFAEEGLAGWMSGPGRGVPGHFPPGEIRRSQGAGVRAAGRDRPAAVAVVGG